MVSISLSVRFHDMMPIVKGRAAFVTRYRPKVVRGIHVELSIGGAPAMVLVKDDCRPR